MKVRDTSKPAFVYTLSDPRTLEIKYVGCTRKPIQRRKTHKSGHDQTTGAWVKMLKAAGLSPVFSVVRNATAKTARDEEASHIRLCVRAGHRLLNTNGVGGSHFVGLDDDYQTEKYGPPQFTPARHRYDLHGIDLQPLTATGV